MRLLRSHWGFFLLLAAAAPATAFFCWQDGIASMGDDSVSYLLLARHFAGAGNELIAPWLPLHAHFGPLFPLALAASGGAEDWRIAHMLVGAFSLAACAALYRFALAATGRRDASLLLVALFLLAPSAWISIKGILSEPLFLLLTLLALHWHATRLAARGAPASDWAAFGALLAAAWLTRTAGVALVAAYAVHAGSRFRAGERGGDVARLVLPVAVVALAAATWWLLRPAAPADGYAHTLSALLSSWRGDPMLMLEGGARSLYGGWVRSFLVDDGGAFALRAVIATLGVAAVAGAVLRAWRNALDGWYVLASMGMLMFWVFDLENTRRLLYPVLPLAIFHAGCALAGLSRLADRLPVRALVAAGAAVVAAVSAPALLHVLFRATEREPFLDASAHAPADMTDYYLTVDQLRARAVAAKHAAVLTGFELLNRFTPPEAAVMWVRPEYVALLGNRRGVPYQYGWDSATLAREARRTGARYIVSTTLAKTDLAHRKGDPLAVAQVAAAYATPILSVPNVVAGGEEFVLLYLDPGRLARHAPP